MPVKPVEPEVTAVDGAHVQPVEDAVREAGRGKNATVTLRLAPHPFKHSYLFPGEDADGADALSLTAAWAEYPSADGKRVTELARAAGFDVEALDSEDTL